MIAALKLFSIKAEICLTVVLLQAMCAPLKHFRIPTGSTSLSQRQSIKKRAL